MLSHLAGRNVYREMKRNRELTRETSEQRRSLNDLSRRFAAAQAELSVSRAECERLRGAIAAQERANHGLQTELAWLRDEMQADPPRLWTRQAESA